MQEEYTAKQLSQILSKSVPAIHKMADRLGWKTTCRPNPKGGGTVKHYSNLDEQTHLQLCAYHTPKPAPSTCHLPAERKNSASTALLSETQMSLASSKVDLLMHYLRAIKAAGYGKKAKARDDFMAAYNSGFAFPSIYKVVGEVSWQTVESWKRTMRSGGDLTHLADRRGRWRRGRSSVSAQEAALLLQCAFHPNKWTMSEIIMEAKSRLRGMGIDDHCSDITYRRWLNHFKEHNYDIWCWQRGGEKRWNDECCLAIDRDPKLISVGDVLVADGHKLNFEILNPWTQKPQRMTLIVFYDMRSSYPCGWEIMPTENTVAISVALRRAIITLGKMPRVVYLDNGRAFKAQYFVGTDLEQSGLKGIYEQLGIQTVFTWAYHGQSKTVERFFGVTAQLERKCPTYVGTSIDKKPPRMNRGEFQHRKIYEKIMDGRCVTLENAYRTFAAWFDEYAHRKQEHSKYLKGYAPIDLFEPGRGKGVDPIELTTLMWARKNGRIRGSRIEHRGRFYYHDEFYGRHHKVEIRYDLQDPGYIAVYENGEFLCITQEQDKVHPMAILGSEEDRAKLKEQLKIKARQKRHASTINRKILEDEILPAHFAQLERDGLTPQGAPRIEEKPEPKQLTRSDKEDIEREVAEYHRLEEKQMIEQNPFAGLDDLDDVERYERLVKYDARGILIPKQWAAFMRYFEQTPKCRRLQDSGYWEQVRTSEIILAQASNQ